MSGGEDIQNKAEEWKGATKETVGDLTGNERLEAEGNSEKVKAKARQTIEDIKDGIEDVKDHLEGAAEVAKDKLRKARD